MNSAARFVILVLLVAAGGAGLASLKPGASPTVTATATPAAPPLTPEERAAGFKIGAGWDQFEVLSRFETVEAAGAQLADGDRVLAVEIGGEARAYPLHILDHHEIVSDTVGGIPILASW